MSAEAVAFMNRHLDETPSFEGLVKLLDGFLSEQRAVFATGRRIRCCDTDVAWQLTRTTLGWEIMYAVCTGCVTLYVHEADRPAFLKQKASELPTPRWTEWDELVLEG